MLSTMGHQQQLLQARFGERYPDSWLVWEPSAWSPPAADGGSESTRVPTGPLRPVQGDALCYELKAEPGTTLRVGRVAETNEVVINDVTVSRSHLTLAVDAQGRWSVTPVPMSKPSSIGGAALLAGQATPLRSGAAIQVGGVTLTFYSSADFQGRIQTPPTGGRARP